MREVGLKILQCHVLMGHITTQSLTQEVVVMRGMFAEVECLQLLVMVVPNTGSPIVQAWRTHCKF